nr:MAG TPA: hypothetical protein [Caudoviricetes sp.]
MCSSELNTNAHYRAVERVIERLYPFGIHWYT